MAAAASTEYEEQLEAVDAALAKDPTNEEWRRLRADLLEVIELKQQLSAVKGEAAHATASSSAQADVSNLRSYAIGDKCQAIFEGDGHWYNAKVVALAEDGCFIIYLGFGNTAQVEFSELRPYVRPDTTDWRPGTDCTAISPADSRWYEAKIVSVKPAAAVVRFAGEAETQEVELDSVRLKKAAAPAPAASSSSSTAQGEEPKVPKQMEIRADDSEETVARKKRKLNMYRRQEKKDKEDKATDDRRNSWQSFQKKNKTISKSKNNHDPNWDPTRNRDEAASRERMERGFGPSGF